MTNLPAHLQDPDALLRRLEAHADAEFAEFMRRHPPPPEERKPRGPSKFKKSDLARAISASEGRTVRIERDGSIVIEPRQAVDKFLSTEAAAKWGPL
jgi:hypothetical protein